MTPDKMKERTKQFALRILRLVSALPRKPVADILARQLTRSGTSVGANYRAACRGRSKAEFVAKLGIVEEELDECLYWMELITEESLIPKSRLEPLMIEANEILSMIVASIRTTRARARKAKSATRNPKSEI
jgi:four helix bundle protein